MKVEEPEKYKALVSKRNSAIRAHWAERKGK